MSGDVHVRFCERPGVRRPRATHLVVMCRTKAAVEEARGRVSAVLTRLGLELHPEKTRVVDLSWGHEGFDFLGCHLRKRLSGPIWERTHRRVHFLQRSPSQRAMARVRARVRDLTPWSRCHTDLRHVIADLNPVLRGWGQSFRTGNAANHFIDIDAYVRAPSARENDVPGLIDALVQILRSHVSSVVQTGHPPPSSPARGADGKAGQQAVVPWLLIPTVTDILP